MIVLKTNPVGIDKRIQGVQSYLYEQLTDWNLNALGRAELVEKKPITFYKNNDYKPALVIDREAFGKFFFIENSTENVSRNRMTSNIDLIFLLDIKKIKPSITHRADEEVSVEILKALKNKVKRTEIDSVLGIKALKGFDTTLKDLQPYQFFKYSFEINYKINEC